MYKEKILNNTKKSNIIKLIISILLPQVVGVIGSLFTMTSVSTWYASLKKPAFNPPDWIFGPVWTTLYLLMGMALFLVWKQGFQRQEIKCAVAHFGIQLGLNLMWSFLFFYLRMPFIAFVEIVILWISIAITLFQFLKISRPAGILFVPYFLWVSFAVVLNFFLWLLNN
jgi:tryptophan-rich sensory protein